VATRQCDHGDGPGTVRKNVASALRILESLFEASENQDFGSVPELFCGVAREDGLGPVPGTVLNRPDSDSTRSLILVACYLQAWSAAGVFLILLAILNKVIGFQRCVLIDSPTMPFLARMAADRRS